MQQSSMDLVSPSEHLCYVRCTYCNTVLAVGVPCKRLMDTGDCEMRPLQQPLLPQPAAAAHGAAALPNDHHHPMGPFQEEPAAATAGLGRHQVMPAPELPLLSSEQSPEKKHRLPSAYNRFMREEIQRIKAAKPDIPHREAFSMAAKNWAKCDPRCSSAVSASNSTSEPRSVVVPGPQERANEQVVESFDIFKQMERSG